MSKIEFESAQLEANCWTLILYVIEQFLKLKSCIFFLL